MHAFVTGGAGFIGLHLVEMLVAQDHDVTVLLMPGESGDQLPARVPRVTGDILDPAGLRGVVPACDIVYHLAARTDLDGQTARDYAVNTDGTTNVLEAAARVGASRFVFYSSMLAAAFPSDATPVDESNGGPPNTAYGKSKRDAEKIVAAGGIGWTVIRPTFVYGPRERATIFSLFSAIHAGRFMLIGRDAPQSYVYVRNLVRATIDASLCAAATGEVFLVSDARPYALAEFAGEAAHAMGRRLPRWRLPRGIAMAVAYALLGISKVSGRPVPLFPSRVRTMTSPYVYSVEKAIQVFGYAPEDDLPGFMRATIAEAAGAGSLEGLMGLD